MRLKTVILENFGPFSSYQLDLPTDDKSCTLLTGKNNAGKTTIIRALRILGAAMSFANGSATSIKRQLYKKDIDKIDLVRMIHNYDNNGKAIITGILDTEREITVTLDASTNTASCELPAHSPRLLSTLLGFIPPLGQLSEKEELLNKPHILRSLNTSLAPLHLRNHFHHLLTEDQFVLVKGIVNDSWEGITLHDCKLDSASGILLCPYIEGNLPSEIALAGQGFQIWLQIVTHTVRLSHTSTLVLDEPEIYLHPSKQYDLIELLRDHYGGGIIIATHSTELMNSVDISHIIHIQRGSQKSVLRRVSDRAALDSIRKSVGSSFNLVASQFENVDVLIATENQLDYTIVAKLASRFAISTKSQNIRISGFQNWKHCTDYRQAYYMFFGRQVKCILLLDRDYYPDEYLDSIVEEASKDKIRVVFTPGKEIENLFLQETFLRSLIPSHDTTKLEHFLDSVYAKEYDRSFATYVEFHNRHSNERKAYSTTYLDYKPSFDTIWNDRDTRHNLIPGKTALAKLRNFFKDEYGVNLTTSLLISRLATIGNPTAKSLISQLFN